MTLHADSPAVEFARRHIEAYTNGDLQTARANAAEDMQAHSNDVNLNGIDQ